MAMLAESERGGAISGWLSTLRGVAINIGEAYQCQPVTCQ